MDDPIGQWETDGGSCRTAPSPVYLILDVDYRHRTDYGRSLAWIAPPLEGASELRLTENDTETESGRVYCGRCKRWMHWLDVDDKDKLCVDADGHDLVTLHRKWAGMVSGQRYAELTRDWCLDDDDSEQTLGMITEYGHLAARAFNFDGMDWNAGGETPIAYASLYVSIPAEN